MAEPDQNGERLVDPAVTLAKLERELARFRADAEAYARRGCWLVDVQSLRLHFVFGTPNARPPALVFGAALDFTDYDFRAPSVHLVDPFTRVPYRFKELPTRLPRRAPAQGVTPEMLAAMGIQPGAPVQVIAHEELMQAYEPDDVPILCMRGVRAYHANPGHTGDPWLLHRTSGAGSLADLLEQLLKYGVAPINGFQIQMSIALQQGGISE